MRFNLFMAELCQDSPPGERVDVFGDWKTKPFDQCKPVPAEV